MAKGQTNAGSPIIEVDANLDLYSENPVQNKVVTEALDAKQDTLIQGSGITISNNTISVTDSDKYLKNDATANYAYAIGGTSNQNYAIGIGYSSNAIGTDGAIAIGRNSTASGSGSIAIGSGLLKRTTASSTNTVAIGDGAQANAANAIQLGSGTNTTAHSLQVESYTLLDTLTGLIPDGRISSNIARTSSLAAVATSGNYNDLSNTPSMSSYLENRTTSEGSLAILGGSDVSQFSVALGNNIFGNNSEHVTIVGNQAEAAKATGVNNANFATAIGDNSKATQSATSLGAGALALNVGSMALGSNARVAADHSIQIGSGINAEDNTLKVGSSSGDNYKLLDLTTGKIPDDRISSNIARTSDIPPAVIVDQTYNASSTNAQSGVAVASAVASATSGYLQNTATGTGSLTISGTASNKQSSVNIGPTSEAKGYYATAVGYGAVAGYRCTAIGLQAETSFNVIGAIQIGKGINYETGTLCVGLTDGGYDYTYKLLGLDGIIPADRLPVMTGADGTSVGIKGAVPAPAATDNNKFLRGDGTWAEAGVTVDNSTINKNASNELQAIAVLNKNSSAGATNPLNLWEGTSQAWTNGEATPWYYWQTDVTAMWQSEGSLPSSASWLSVTYGDGKFVAIDYNSNKAAYSYDGITWTEITLPSSEYWGLTYGDGKFVTIGYISSKAAYSTDGINWVESTMPSSASWRSVTYGDGKFVAVASNSDIAAYSYDGINWTASTLPSSAYWSSVTYGDGKFVVVANINSNKAAYSTDGINWTDSTLPSNGSWSVTYGDGKFVAVGSSKAAYSTDGINWVESTLPSSANWQSVTYGDGKFVAVAYNSNKSAYSTDGINWTTSTMPSSASWNSVTYGNNKFVAVASKSDIAAIFTMSYDKCYTLDQTPTISTQVYSAPETLSAKTITSVGSGTITLSDSLTYNYTPGGNQNTYRTIGDAHPDWLCNIEGVGVKIGNTLIAEKNSGSTVTIDSSITASSTNANAAGSKAVWDLVSALEARVAALESQLAGVETQLANI